MYDTLAKLPIVIFEEISNTGNLALLLQENETAVQSDLEELWQKLSIEFSEKSKNKDTNRNFRLQKDIDALECKHRTIALMLECLKFDWNNELVAVLRSWGYSVTQKDYYDNLDRIERESKALLVKSANLKTMLPKKASDTSETSIYDVLASYCAILSLDFDFETLSCLKYISLQRQVASKIKASEQNAEANKPKRKR